MLHGPTGMKPSSIPSENWSSGLWPMSFSAMDRARVADQDDEDEEDDARERDAVALEATPDLLPVAARPDVAFCEPFGQRDVGLADLASDSGVFSRGRAHVVRASPVGMRVRAYPGIGIRIPI